MSSEPPMGLLGASSALDVLETEAELLRRLAKSAHETALEYDTVWGDGAGDYHRGVSDAYQRVVGRLVAVARHLRETP